MTSYDNVSHFTTGPDGTGFRTVVDWAASSAGFTLNDGDVLVMMFSLDATPSITALMVAPGDWTHDVSEEWTAIGLDVRVHVWSKVWSSGDDQSTYTAEWMFPDPYLGGGAFWAMYWAGATGIASVTEDRYPDPAIAGTEHDAIPGFSDGSFDMVVPGAKAGLVATNYEWDDGNHLAIGCAPTGFTSLDLTDPTGFTDEYDDDANTLGNFIILRGLAATITPPPPTEIRASRRATAIHRLSVS